MNYNTIKLYGKTLFFRRGMTILVNLTFRCNLKCEYCNMIIPTGKIKMFDHGFDFWVNKIENFTSIHKVKEIMVSGGEPTLISWMPNFVHWLLNKGYHVTILCNGFRVDRILEIPNSYRLQVSMSYHHHTDKVEMQRKYDVLASRGYRVNIKELLDGKPRQFSYSIPALRHCTKPEHLLMEDKSFPVLNFGANGQLYSGCYAMYEDCAVPKEEQK